MEKPLAGAPQSAQDGLPTEVADDWAGIFATALGTMVLTFALLATVAWWFGA